MESIVGEGPMDQVWLSKMDLLNTDGLQANIVTKVLCAMHSTIYGLILDPRDVAIIISAAIISCQVIIPQGHSGNPFCTISCVNGPRKV